jgi:Mn-containing catalase
MIASLHTAAFSQAIRRIHRLGQTSETVVYTYIKNDTVEKDMYAKYMVGVTPVRTSRKRRRVDDSSSTDDDENEDNDSSGDSNESGDESGAEEIKGNN